MKQFNNGGLLQMVQIRTAAFYDLVLWDRHHKSSQNRICGLWYQNIIDISAINASPSSFYNKEQSIGIYGL